ncbi:ELAV-like protein 2 [Bolinopsis microptera]|uniref:ELAV-like protein 2 n=1 Tax=Bolinopsis microptera TaxID=2820187 RepID=UPI003078B3EE
MADKLTPDQKKKLMINYLPRSVEVNQLKGMFEKFGEVANAHIVKNTATNESKGYGFITFEDENSAVGAIIELNGHQMEDKRLRVAYSTPIDDTNRSKAAPAASNDDVNVYIANLPKTWDEKELTARFETYGPVKHCKILRDVSGASRGAGFVRYETSKMAAAAILDMDDRCPEGGSLPLIVKIADGKKKEKPVAASINHSGLPGLVLNHNPSTASALQAMTAVPPSNNGYTQHSHNVDHRYNPYSKPPSHSQTPPPSAYSHPGAYPPIGSSYSSPAPSGSHSNPNPYSAPSPYNSTPPQHSAPSNTVIPGYNPPPHSHPMMAPSSMAPGPGPVPAAAINNKNNHYCIYIGNLPETTCKSCLLYQLFSPYGAIANVKPMSNVKPDGGNDHWFAFVNFKSHADAATAIQSLNGSTLNGRSLKVDFKTEKRK